MCGHMLTVQHAQLNFNPSGIPYASDYQDTYFSQAGAVEECQHVFIHGNQLPQRWSQKNFTIAELGFGCGINFLTTASEWLKHAHTDSRLHFISFEKTPVKPEDLKKIHTQLSCDPVLSRQLLTHYPPPVKGCHRLHFAQNKITLTLIFGDAIEQLQNNHFEADVWYLDGFSPDKNPSMWCAEVAQRIYQLTKHQGTFSTYSVASEVKRNFSAAGFECQKSTGFAHKKHMLVGTCSKPSPLESFHYREKSWLQAQPVDTQTSTQSAIIIGAGMAGFNIAAALAKRHWHCTIIDKYSDIAKEGSGNANAILMPRLSVDHDVQSQLTLQGFLYSLQLFKQLDKQTPHTLWHECGAIQMPRDAMQASRMQQIQNNEPLPPELMQAVTQPQAEQLSACAVNKGGWYIPRAGWIVPAQLCHALWDQYPQQIEFKGGHEITHLRQQDSYWQVMAQDKIIAQAEHVIIANALAGQQFEQTSWCMMHAKRGQLSHIPQSLSTLHPQKILCSDVYITPAVNQHYILGASFISADTDTSIRHVEHESNIEKLNKMLSDHDQLLTLNQRLEAIGGRAGVRAVSPDRLPIVGQVAVQDHFMQDFSALATGNTRHHYPRPDYYPGLYIATGFGSRGCAWIPLCAEALACTMNNEPSPYSTTIAQALHPNRYLVKQLIAKSNSMSDQTDR